MWGQQGRVVPRKPSRRGLPQASPPHVVLRPPPCASPPPGGPQPMPVGASLSRVMLGGCGLASGSRGIRAPDPRHPSLPRRGLRQVSVSVQASAGTCVRCGQACVQGDWLPSHPTAPRQLRPGVALWPTRGEHRARVLRLGPGCVGTRLTRTSGSCGQCSLGTASVAGRHWWHPCLPGGGRALVPRSLRGRTLSSASRNRAPRPRVLLGSPRCADSAVLF